MDKKLFATRKDIYSKCPSIYWSVSAFTLLFAIALAAFEAVVPGLSILTFGLLFFPLLYSAYISLYTIKLGGTISFKSTFMISRSYFKPSSFGCFRIFKNLLAAIIVYVLASTVFCFIFYYIFNNVYGSLFRDSIQQMLDLINASDEAFADFLAEDNPLTFYLNVVSACSYCAGLIAFIFGITYYAPVVYISANLPNGRGNLAASIFSFFLKKNKREYRADFFSLNWPLFLLLVFGMNVGFFLVLALNQSPSMLQHFAIIGGLVFIIPMSPFYFASCESLFAKYDEEIKKSSKDMTIGFLKKIKQQGNLSEEDLAKVNAVLNKESQDQENKKDSEPES